MSEPRVSDSALCRRIAQALGWKGLGLTPDWLCKSDSPQYGKPVLVGLNPDGYNDRVPFYDTDPAACMELLDALLADGWSIEIMPSVYAAKYEPVHVVLHNHPRDPAAASGADFRQAFAKAAAAALEAQGR